MPEDNTSKVNFKEAMQATTKEIIAEMPGDQPKPIPLTPLEKALTDFCECYSLMGEHLKIVAFEMARVKHDLKTAQLTIDDMMVAVKAEKDTN